MTAALVLISLQIPVPAIKHLGYCFKTVIWLIECLSPSSSFPHALLRAVESIERLCDIEGVVGVNMGRASTTAVKITP